MANELTSASIVVQQALHGYGDGHRLLAGSFSLQPPDARAMLVLSDGSSSSAKVPNGGYLTGYPLAKSGKYVLARTWAAPEMPRPGCVWTHSLLIDFADLAQLASTDELAAFFHRPERDNFAGYEKKLKLRLSSLRKQEITGGFELCTALLSGLYRSPLSKVVAPFDQEDGERLVLSIWMQQWPKLRRGFRFCTFSGADRSMPSEPFDLQLVDRNELFHRARIPEAFFVSPGPIDPTVQLLVEDLLRPDEFGLRKFLRSVGGDVSVGRGGMLPLTRLFSAVSSIAGREVGLGGALDALEELGPSQAGAARELVLNRALADVDGLDDRALDFVLDSLPPSSMLSSELADRLGRALWSRRPLEFLEMLAEDGAISHVARVAVSSLPVPELVQGIGAFPSFGHDVVRLRPEVLTEMGLWRVLGPEAASLLEDSSVLDSAVVPVIAAVISAGRGDLAEIVVEKLSASSTLLAIDALAGSASASVFEPWVRILAGRIPDLTDALVGGRLRLRTLMSALAHAIDPDSVPNDFGDDPWVVAQQKAIGSLSTTDEDYLAAFLLARALGLRTRQPAELMTLAIQQVYQSLEMGRMSWDGWQLINRRLSWVMPWMEWDRCARVRQAVVDRFVYSELEPRQFGLITDDERVFTALAETAASSGKGRRFLEKVRRVLSDNPQERVQRRLKQIEWLCR